MAGEIQLATLSTPLALQQGDVATVEGTRLVVRRAGQVVASVALGPISQPLEHAAAFGDLGSINHVFWSKPVTNQIKVITKLERLPDNKYFVEWDNADGQEFNDWEALVTWASAVVTDPEFAKRLSVAAAVARSPDGTGLQSLVGIKVTIAPNAYGNEATVEVPPQ